jgi:phosphocarrier protein HPr
MQIGAPFPGRESLASRPFINLFWIGPGIEVNSLDDLCVSYRTPYLRLNKHDTEHHFEPMRKEFEIVNELGLHARPAAQFVRCVVQFKSTITICKGEENISAASILGVLTANLNCGDRVVLEAVGPDEQEALNELGALLLRFRDEEAGAHPT